MTINVDMAINASSTSSVSAVSPLVVTMQPTKVVDPLKLKHQQREPLSVEIGSRLDFQLAPFWQVKIKPAQPAATAIAFDDKLTTQHRCPCCSYVLLRHIRLSGVYWRCSHCYAEMPAWV